MYHIQCSSNFRTGKGNLKKSVMPRKRGRYTTADKKRVFLEIVEHIDSHPDEHFDITIQGKMMDEKLSGNNAYIQFKQFCGPPPQRLNPPPPPPHPPLTTNK